MGQNISIILPVYNEKDNIETTVKSILDFLPRIADKFEIILVDDGSVDGTGSIIKTLSQNSSCIKEVYHHKNIGYGVTLKSGFKIAQYPLLFFMDSDGQYEISEIVKLIGYIGEFDIVVGVRTIRRDSWHRITLGILYNLVICLLFRLKLRDITCGFKLIRKSAIERMELKSTGGFINAEILIKAKRKGYLIKEVNIEHLQRTKGAQGGANPRVFIKKIVEMFRLYWDMKS